MQNKQLNLDFKEKGIKHSLTANFSNLNSFEDLVTLLQREFLSEFSARTHNLCVRIDKQTVDLEEQFELFHNHLSSVEAVKIFVLSSGDYEEETPVSVNLLPQPELKLNLT